jgi:uncharacterized protein YbbC (DUF1343 family)
MKYFLVSCLIALSTIACSQTEMMVNSINQGKHFLYPQDIETGAERTYMYLDKIKDKTVGIIANHSSMIRDQHLVDSLLSLGIKVKCVFSPEHGFRGKAAAGEKVNSKIDKKTGLPIISLYGSHKKPTAEDLEGIDVVLFDIQDVGLRFYTYISTLHLAMEACAENNVKMIVLDRPNPHGHYVDGPVLDPQYSSFVGMDPIPIVHGLTVGEYALMVNGEYWLNDSLQCDLQVIPVWAYEHSDLYQLPIAPSPNLPNMASIYLYPSLCLFEGTPVSVGRGTSKPFQMYGHPSIEQYDTSFTPMPVDAAPRPKLNGQKCYGYDLSNFGATIAPQQGQIYLYWLIEVHREMKTDGPFFKSFFDKLAGTDALRLAIEAGASEEAIRDSWKAELQAYKTMRKKYLLYPDFE